MVPIAVFPQSGIPRGRPASPGDAPPAKTASLGGAGAAAGETFRSARVPEPAPCEQETGDARV